MALTLALVCGGGGDGGWEDAPWRELVEGSGRCLVRNNYFVMEATRPIADCQRLCGGDNSDDGGGGAGGVVKIFSANVTREEFEPWAYLSRPLVVRGGALHWPALHVFSESFFRSLYDGVPGSYGDVAQECQFLPFRTHYLTLQEALTRQTRPEHWYFGW